MAKKVAKKTETTEVVETPVVEPSQSEVADMLNSDEIIIEDINTRMEEEAKEILTNTIKEASDKNSVVYDALFNDKEAKEKEEREQVLSMMV